MLRANKIIPHNSKLFKALSLMLDLMGKYGHTESNKIKKIMTTKTKKEVAESELVIKAYQEAKKILQFFTVKAIFTLSTGKNFILEDSKQTMDSQEQLCITLNIINKELDLDRHPPQA
jgi:hypothetical protein